MTTRSTYRRSRASAFAYGVLAIFMLGVRPASPAAATARVVQEQPPDSLTDAEFWKFFTTMSEPDGYFLSENFVSNEVSFQEVIPSLQKTLTPGGVYLGVGPEQNFTYIANIAPRMAVIFDIRRQNAMQHLMYKALFEMSATRPEFVANLFSRPSVAKLAPSTPVKVLFDSAAAAVPDDSAYEANFAAILQRLMVTHGFALPATDIESIEHVFGVFFAAGPEVNYGYRSGNPAFVRSTYPSFAMLQAATNADSVEMAFLANEETYQTVRRLQLRNLIVPVVGDFGGPSAIRSVGNWLTERQMTVVAFYVSNVEQYLFRDRGASDRFYANLTALPLDMTSSFIRSVPGMGSPMATFLPGTSGRVPSGVIVTVARDSMGLRFFRTYRDSSGVQVVIDSTARPATRDSLPRDTTIAGILQAARDSIRRANSWQVMSAPVTTIVRGGGLLASGTASMQKTLERFFAGELKSYDVIIGMTKVSGWR